MSAYNSQVTQLKMTAAYAARSTMSPSKYIYVWNDGDLCPRVMSVIAQNRHGPSPSLTPVKANVHWVLLELRQESYIIMINKAEHTVI